MTLSTEEVVDWVNQLEKESKAIRHELLKMCWFMRGSLSYEEATLLSMTERKIIADIIKDNIETTKKTGVSFI